jgi:hypothetical protein
MSLAAQRRLKRSAARFAPIDTPKNRPEIPSTHPLARPACAAPGQCLEKLHVSSATTSEKFPNTIIQRALGLRVPFVAHIFFLLFLVSP